MHEAITSDEQVDLHYFTRFVTGHFDNLQE